MKVYIDKRARNFYFYKLYENQENGRIKVKFRCCNPGIDELTFYGINKEDIQKQIDNMFDYVNVPTMPKGKTVPVKAMKVKLSCPLCESNLKYRSDYFSLSDYYHHKCENCIYECDVPHIHNDQVVWVETENDVYNALTNKDIDKLKAIAETKPEL